LALPPALDQRVPPPPVRHRAVITITHHQPPKITKATRTPQERAAPHSASPHPFRPFFLPHLLLASQLPTPVHHAPAARRERCPRSQRPPPPAPCASSSPAATASTSPTRRLALTTSGSHPASYACPLAPGPLPCRPRRGHPRLQWRRRRTPPTTSGPSSRSPSQRTPATEVRSLLRGASLTRAYCSPPCDSEPTRTLRHYLAVCHCSPAPRCSVGWSAKSFCSLHSSDVIAIRLGSVVV
jgi:hypothetical protein